MKYTSKAGHGRGTVAASSGVNSTADVLGGSGVSGSTAYHDLRATDNPYDPRFSMGEVTVGEVKGIDPKKPDEKAANDKPPEKP